MVILVTVHISDVNKHFMHNPVCSWSQPPNGYNSTKEPEEVDADCDSPEKKKQKDTSQHTNTSEPSCQTSQVSMDKIYVKFKTLNSEQFD